MNAAACISGILSEKDIKRLTKTSRSGGVGPTTVYYAGVIAPIISASVAVVVRLQLDRVDHISTYWLWLISSMIAAFAGISWYLIFMRWSYRHTFGRGDETVSPTEISVAEEHMVVKRGHVTTHIGWPAIAEIKKTVHSLIVIIDGSKPVIVPNSWFGKDKIARKAFHAAISSHIKT